MGIPLPAATQWEVVEEAAEEDMAVVEEEEVGAFCFMFLGDLAGSP